jgi:CRP-like cAMP-binding protein
VSESPYSANQNPFAASQSPFSAASGPFSANHNPFLADRGPFSLDRSPFSADPRLFGPLLDRSCEVPCHKVRVLFSQGDSPVGIYLVEAGEAALVMTSARGLVATCFHAGAGSVLGLPAVVADQPYSLTAMADKGSEIGFVARGDFEALMRAEPDLYLYVLQVLAAEVRSARLAATGWRGEADRSQFRTPAAP